MAHVQPSADPHLRTLWSQIRHQGVKHLWIFGSRARGDSGPESDYDFLVEFASPPGFDAFMNLKLDLEEGLGFPVDLLSLHACPPRWLRAIHSELRRVA